LGSGHGIGVSYARSETFPWRYEMVWVATVFRVGLFGALVYTFIFLLYIADVLIKLGTGALSVIDKFYFAGFISVYIASNTNPYIESVAFQWMFVFPVVRHFLLRNSYLKKVDKNSQSNTNRAARQ
jgi:hypothetical protein